ncbi:hypothetical protein GQ44DRAFT_766582 [Phaeosphaeriaceae sp. PMI808]|nr:hypothetical protein GQ44DRAFT_766582 [Phaeosphaeriaceae sp. PMI808]
MPPDRDRLTNAQGRQKSCYECAKGKRKCNLGQPSCGRCRKQHLMCIYPQPPRPLDTVIDDCQDNIPEVDYDVSASSAGQVGFGDSMFPLDFDMPALLSAPSANTSSFESGAGTTSLDTLSNTLYSSSNDREHIALERAHQRNERPFSVAHMSSFTKSRLEWSIEQLKIAPKTMVEENCTPWQHHKLYEQYMPRHLQDAHAACALYVTKNGTNNEFVSRFIHGRVEELLASPLPHQSTELLARAHAVMLFQAMLVFGSDIKLYSQAELLLNHMSEIGTNLLTLSTQQSDPMGSLPLYPSTTACAAWTSYIFRESLRRTLLAIHQFATTCRILCGQLVPCMDHLVIGNRVTISAQLWNSSSAFDYALAWNNSKHFLVKELDFNEVFRDAKAEDVGTFAKMLMIGLHGEDDIKGWFYTRGATL